MAYIYGIVPLGEATKRVINSVVQITGDPSDIWNRFFSGRDHDSLMTMIKKCGGNGIQEAHLLIGKNIKCRGAAGFGTYPAIVQKVDVGKGWIEVYWTNDKYTAWKTAKLCWMD